MNKHIYAIPVLLRGQNGHKTSGNASVCMWYYYHSSNQQSNEAFDDSGPFIWQSAVFVSAWFELIWFRPSVSQFRIIVFLEPLWMRDTILGRLLARTVRKTTFSDEFVGGKRSICGPLLLSFLRYKRPHCIKGLCFFYCKQCAVVILFISYESFIVETSSGKQMVGIKPWTLTNQCASLGTITSSHGDSYD